MTPTEDIAARANSVGKDVLGILRCPVTKQPLRSASSAEVESANARLGATVEGAAQGTASPSVSNGLVSADGRYLYPIEDGIFLLLPDNSIDIRAEDTGNEQRLGILKSSVRTFYDEFGWTKDVGDLFADARTFEDLRPVSAEYIHRCHLRVNRYIRPTGRFLLDAASGPLQFGEYLTYSAGYERRICVDFSFSALRQAREVLGEQGLYLLADVTNLPLSDGTVDGAVSLHTIYHVPTDEQETAFMELHRVLTAGSQAAVVYSWHRPALMRLLHAPLTLWRAGQRALRERRPTSRDTARSPVPPLYFQPRPRQWFMSRHWPFTYELAVWRTVSVTFLKMYIHEWLAGRQLLDLLYRLEERWPRLCGRVGQYPLIVIKKEA